MTDQTPTLSISESALHKLSLVPKNLEKTFNESVNSIGATCNNSTSSTVEESATVIQEEKTSPVRRKRYKLKKRVRFAVYKNSSCLNYNFVFLVPKKRP